MMPYLGPDHWKTELNGGHLVFGPLENRTSKCSVFQFVWYSNVWYSSPPLFVTQIGKGVGLGVMLGHKGYFIEVLRRGGRGSYFILIGIS